MHAFLPPIPTALSHSVARSRSHSVSRSRSLSRSLSRSHSVSRSVSLFRKRFHCVRPKSDRWCTFDFGIRIL